MFLSVFKFEKKVPVVTVPATYNSITELIAEGSSIIIYASHLLRAAYPTMLGVAESILTNARSVEADATLNLWRAGTVRAAVGLGGAISLASSHGFAVPYLASISSCPALPR